MYISRVRPGWATPHAALSPSPFYLIRLSRYPFFRGIPGLSGSGDPGSPMGRVKLLSLAADLDISTSNERFFDTIGLTMISIASGVCFSRLVSSKIRSDGKLDLSSIGISDKYCGGEEDRVSDCCSSCSGS